MLLAFTVGVIRALLLFSLIHPPHSSLPKDGILDCVFYFRTRPRSNLTTFNNNLVYRRWPGIEPTYLDISIMDISALERVYLDLLDSLDLLAIFFWSWRLSGYNLLDLWIYWIVGASSYHEAGFISFALF
jgi:hypothetical protein